MGLGTESEHCDGGKWKLAGLSTRLTTSTNDDLGL